MEKTKTTRIYQAVALAVALVCMMFSKGVTLQTFTTSESGARVENLATCSFFDNTLLANGNWYPFVAAILVIAALVCVCLAFFVKHKVLEGVICVLTLAALALTFSPIIFYEKEHYTRIAMLISYVLGCASLLSIQQFTGWFFKDYEPDYD